MRKYALLKNNVIINIVDVEDSDIRDLINLNEMVIDITDLNPQPVIGYVLNGNILQVPQNLSSREEYEIELNSKKCAFGQKLSQNAINRIGARNKILNKNGNQVIALLTQLISVKSLLETGALGTARAICSQLKLVYTEYSDIFDHVINEINCFEISAGL